jgi:hypothetical protein
MSKELQEALAEIINLTVQGKDFILDQAPDVIQQLLAWEFTIGLIGFVSGILLTLAYYPWTKIILKMRKKDEAWDFAFIGHSFITLTILLIVYNTQWIQILIAPKVFLLEYAVNLIG